MCIYCAKDVDARPTRRWCWVCFVAKLSRAKHEKVSMHDIYVLLRNTCMKAHMAYIMINTHVCMCCTQGMHGNACIYMSCITKTCMHAWYAWWLICMHGMACMTCMMPKDFSANSCMTWHAAVMAAVARFCDMDGRRLDWQSAHFYISCMHNLHYIYICARYAVWHANAMHSVWQLEQHKDV